MRTFSLLLFSYPVVPTSLWPHGLQHGGPACPSPIPRACRSSCSLHWWCHPAISSPHVLFSFCPDLSQQQDFSNESSVCIRWPKYWNFSFSIRQFSEYSGLILLKTDWFDLLAVQGTLRSLLQHHSSKASVEISITGIPQRAWGDYSVTGDMVCSLQHVESDVGRGLIGRASQWRIVSAVWYRGGTNWTWGQVVRKRSKEVGFGTILKNR